MARRRQPANPEPNPTPPGCDHALVAIRPGAPASWRACDPRLLMAPDLDADTTTIAAEARADHDRRERVLAREGRA
jgi:hypothetical protein